MDIIRYASLKSAPWGKGSGITRQVAAGPDAQDWEWRISLAEAAKAADFSVMPGVDRIVTVVEGDLIALTVDGTEHALEKYRPLRFSGDSDTAAALPTGALTILNFMTRRGAFKGYAAIIELSKKRPHPVFAEQFAVLLQGSATVSPAAPDAAGAALPGEALGKFDTVVGSEAAPELSGRGFVAILSLDRV